MARRVEISDKIVGEVLDGEAVLLDLGSGKYFSLNPTATRMWQLLGERGDLEEVLDALRQEFDVEGATLAEDLDGLVAELIAKGVLRECT